MSAATAESHVTDLELFRQFIGRASRRGRLKTVDEVLGEFQLARRFAAAPTRGTTL